MANTSAYFSGNTNPLLTAKPVALTFPFSIAVIVNPANDGDIFSSSAGDGVVLGDSFLAIKPGGMAGFAHAWNIPQLLIVTAGALDGSDWTVFRNGDFIGWGGPVTNTGSPETSGIGYIGTPPFIGYIQDLAIFNRVLTVAEQAALNDAAFKGSAKYQPLVVSMAPKSYWPLDEAAGAATVRDLGADANDATVMDVELAQPGLRTEYVPPPPDEEPPPDQDPSGPPRVGAEVRQYQEALRALLPPGDALNDEGHGQLTNLLDGLAYEFSRVDARGADLIEEADPRTTTELLEDWERLTGLPDACTPAEQTLDQRRGAVVARLTSQSTPTRAFIIQQAATLGYTVTIEERHARRYRDPVGGRYGNDAWQFVWAVHITGAAAAPELECIMRRYAPAHTIVHFIYEPAALEGLQTADDFSVAGTIDNYSLAAHGAAGTADVVSGDLVLAPVALANNSVTARRAGQFVGATVRAKLPTLGNGSDFFDLTIGSGSLVGDSGATNWWNTVLSSGYVLRWNSRADAPPAFLIEYMDNGANSQIATYDGAIPADLETAYHDYALRIINGRVQALIDNAVIMDVAHTAYAFGDVLLAAGANQLNKKGCEAHIPMVTLTAAA